MPRPRSRRRRIAGRQRAGLEQERPVDLVVIVVVDDTVEVRVAPESRVHRVGSCRADHRQENHEDMSDHRAGPFIGAILRGRLAAGEGAR
ncbi:MAG: hypothetical protein IMZ55_06490 [Acidobacteria bacterium]|nr:hypothetical protein [Acidobacteriota bacterium]